MEPVTQTVVGLVMSLAAASYGHFGVTLKAAPELHHPRAQRSEPIVQRLPASSVGRQRPCSETVAEGVVLVRRA